MTSTRRQRGCLQRMMAPAEHDALRGLVDAYARTMDDRDVATLSRLFVAGGRIVIAAGETTTEYVAPEGFGPIIEQMARYARTFYLVGNHLCEVDGDHATGDTYSIGYHHHDASSDRPARVVEMPIRYRDRYLRTEAGWRFEERVASILWTRRYELT